MGRWVAIAAFAGSTGLLSAIWIPALNTRAVRHAEPTVRAATVTLPTVQLFPTVREKERVTKVTETAEPSVSARAYGVWDAESGQFLAASGVDEVRPIASVTKLMTAVVALESGLDAAKEVVIESDDIDAEGSRLRMARGASFRASDLLLAMLSGSANDAAETVARATGLTEAAFVAAMNAKVAALGMGRTRFTDVTGLGATNVSTVRDLALLLDAALESDVIRAATTAPGVRIEDTKTGRAYAMQATDALLGDLRIVGGKTGFTGPAGGCMVARVRGIGEHELDVIVLGSHDQETRFSETRALADWAFASFRFPD